MFFYATTVVVNWAYEKPPHSENPGLTHMDTIVDVRMWRFFVRPVYHYEHQLTLSISLMML